MSRTSTASGDIQDSKAKRQHNHTQRPKRRKATAPVFDGFVKALRLQNYFQNDKDLSLKIMATVFLGSLLGNSFCRKMTTITYRFAEDADKNWWEARFLKGWDDLAFVLFWIVAFTYIRAVFMKGYFNPMGKRLGIRGSKLERFEEQAYILVYYVTSWASGMALMYYSPYWLSTAHYWIGYPHDKIQAPYKIYYLVQLAFWIQQIYVVNTDMKRKDYWAMLIHHFITCALIGGSYAFHLTPVGNAILVVMDVSDVFLAVPKILKYQGYTAICDYLFGLFVISWAVTRHYLFPLIIMSVAQEPQKLMDMSWDPSRDLFFTKNVQNGFLTLLFGLEGVLCFWFLMIFKVIYKMFKSGAGADDNRSHDEDSDEEEVHGESKEKSVVTESKTTTAKTPNGSVTMTTTTTTTTTTTAKEAKTNGVHRVNNKN